LAAWRRLHCATSCTSGICPTGTTGRATTRLSSLPRFGPPPASALPTRAKATKPHDSPSPPPRPTCQPLPPVPRRHPASCPALTSLMAAQPWPHLPTSNPALTLPTPPYRQVAPAIPAPVIPASPPLPPPPPAWHKGGRAARAAAPALAVRRGSVPRALPCRRPCRVVTNACRHPRRHRLRGPAFRFRNPRPLRGHLQARRRSLRLRLRTYSAICATHGGRSDIGIYGVFVGLRRKTSFLPRPLRDASGLG